MNDKAAAGMIATLANNIPMFGLMKEMDNRGKILNVAFAVKWSLCLEITWVLLRCRQEHDFLYGSGKLVGGISQ